MVQATSFVSLREKINKIHEDRGKLYSAIKGKKEDLTQWNDLYKNVRDPSLLNEISKLKNDIYLLRRDVQEKDYEINKLKFVLKKKIAEANNTALITDHAIVRYMERVKRIQREKIQNEIATDYLIHAYNFVRKDGLYASAPPNDPNRFYAVIKNGSIVSIYDELDNSEKIDQKMKEIHRELSRQSTYQPCN